MRLHAVVHHISIPIYQLTPCSHLPNYLRDPTVGVELTDTTMADKGKSSILSDAVMLLRSDVTYGPRLLNCWLPASTWVEALKKSVLIDASLIIDERKFNTAISKSVSFGEAMQRFDGSNTTGVFRITFKKKFYDFFTE